MQKFSFNMQKILDLRNYELDQAELDLGKVNAEIARVNSALDQIARDRVDYGRIADESHDFTMHSQTRAFFILLEQKKDGLLAELAQLEVIAEQKREVVRLAMQKVKVLEKLKEKKYAQWKAEFEAQEELAMDDAVTAQQYRKSTEEE
ncbi:MAG: flagellar export protein FliJ [Treponema sp.]|nr:flagellar export protein FliJ [Treponema sp.]